MALSRDCRHGRQIGKCADCDLDHMEMAADAEARRVDELTALRKQDAALIRQLVEALENSNATLWEEDDDPSRPAHAAITAGRARLEGMTDKPTPTTDLLKRCAEIHEWRSTGVLSGEALHDYAKRKWPGRHDTLQMAEHETVTEALALLAKWGQPQAGAVPLTGEYPALVCDYCGALTPDPWHSSGMLHGKMSKHIHSCDACAARGVAKAQDTPAYGST